MVSDPLAELARLEGVPTAIVAAQDAVDSLLRDRGLRHVTTEQQASALLASARANARLTDDPDRWLPGAVRLSSELVSLSDLIRVSPGQALARAHALAAHGQLPDHALGRLQPNGGALARIAELRSLLTEPTSAPAVVVAAVAHAELASVAPFGSADGIVARAVEHMVLIASGVDPRAVIVVEAGHLALRASYEGALADYASGSVAGVRAWLLHCASAVARGAEASPVRPTVPATSPADRPLALG